MNTAHEPTKHIETADGHLVGYRTYQPEGSPRALLIIASAMGVSQDFYSPFARWLASQGVATYTFDYRGTGASRPAGGSLKGFRATIEDWARFDCAAMIDVATHGYP